MRRPELEINFQKQGVMIIANIEPRQIDELGQTIVKGIAVDNQGLGGQGGVEPAAEKGPGRQKKLVRHFLEFGR